MYEVEIQQQFVQWLTARDGYRELFNDPNGGAGATVDSIGFVGQRPVLIEFKRRVIDSAIRYSPIASTSIERKLRNSLQALYQGNLLELWKRDSVPLVLVVAGTVPVRERTTLKELLEQRAEEWRFEYEFGVWDGTAYCQLGSGPASPVVPGDWATVRFPEMPWPGAPRLPSRTLQELSEIAYERGAGLLFDEMIVQARQRGLGVSRNRDNLVLGRAPVGSKRRRAVCSIWPTDSDAHGLCVGTSNEGAATVFGRGSEPMRLPGVAAPPRGYLGDRRFLRSTEEIEAYWRLLTGSDPASPE